MIIFSLESLHIATRVIKAEGVKGSNIFINDGNESRELLDFEVKYIDFEVNGMYQALESSYVLRFSDTTITYSLNGDKAKITPFKSSLPVRDTGMPSEVSAFQF